MIGISTPVYDLNGSRVFRQADIANLSGARRVTRTATLDGGVSVYDTGYTDSDRECSVVEVDAGAAAIEFARRIVATYDSIIISMDDGAYRGVPESHRMNGGDLEMKVLITEKISE
jgi:hypothetical protein